MQAVFAYVFLFTLSLLLITLYDVIVRRPAERDQKAQNSYVTNVNLISMNSKQWWGHTVVRKPSHEVTAFGELKLVHSK